MSPRFTGKATSEFDFREVIYEKKGWVATVTINRPHVYNSYSTLTLQELTTAFRDASWDDSVAVVVLTGAGEKAFCSGGDVKEYAEDYTKKPRDYWKWMGVFTECHDILRNIGKPTIARINGMVVGGGNEFNMACDLAIMVEDASIQQVGTMVGSVAAGGATQWLPIIVGDRRAREMLFLSEPVPAQKCLEWGLVNQVVPRAQLDEAVATMADKLVHKFPECLRYTKQQTNFWKDLAWSSTVGHAKEWLALHFASVEPYEGMNAFVEKRPKDYIGLRTKAAEGGSSEFLYGPYTHTCPSCGAKGIPEAFKFCGVCGTELKRG
ncbi:Crotonase superfamily [Acididesulfobacillus acetoxydans]|uniref:1,4-Dihydroxy-2-naphthoyl-CoA synthase n=1 Tax=Acididesulfobacillus acetoxydans TaxID=1561005 RepID=A0A8S0WXQ5_9FIRM|nr:enoyl-CoA hydratase-related protein [Acididesulfobacillus acetoxydans]CAA7601111.1 Crotonase superfamily [Acididesulfobacillus acetoxydans]CEJ07142.1 1,4-Dihydroxy-2-naphthoyl-CoA synthase [Acididesulfobacillus acetoxydans]